jgi:hypothetical protein
MEVASAGNGRKIDGRKTNERKINGGLVKPLVSILRYAFGCHHRRRSGVFTIKKRTYQVCLKCGREFEYSWALMHSVRSSHADSSHAPLPPKVSYLAQTPKSTPVIIVSPECVDGAANVDS